MIATSKDPTSTLKEPTLSTGVLNNHIETMTHIVLEEEDPTVSEHTNTFHKDNESHKQILLKTVKHVKMSRVGWILY